MAKCNQLTPLPFKGLKMLDLSAHIAVKKHDTITTNYYCYNTYFI